MGRIIFSLVTAGICLAAPLAAQPDSRGPQPPVFVNCPETLLFSCSETFQHQFLAVHPHSQKPFGKIRYRLTDGPGQIDSLTGLWQSNIEEMVSYLGSPGITVAAEIQHGHKTLRASRNVQIVTTGGAPSIQFSSDVACGDTLQTMAGTPFTLAMSIYNSQGCGTDSYQLSNLTVDQAPSGSCVWGPDSTQLGCDLCYVLSFEPSSLDAGTTFGFTWMLSDGFDTATCSVFVEVQEAPIQSADYAVRIGTATQVSPGQPVTVPVYLERADSVAPPGGFDFLIAYDSTALLFQGATPGELIAGCAWEYFTYQSVSNGCGGSCPGGLLRVMALADLANGDAHPVCDMPAALPAEMFSLSFLIPADQPVLVQFAPLRFFWLGCADNAIVNGDGSLLLVSDTVFDFDGTSLVGGGDTLPGFGGLSDTSVSCLSASAPRLLRAVDFYNGVVEIVNAPVTVARGDLNLNGTPYEMADLDVFANYFRLGLSALGSQTTSAESASDINGNEAPLEMADFVCGQRIAVGSLAPDAVPSDTSPVLATIIHARLMKQILVASGDTLGGAQFVFSGNLGTVIASRPGFTVGSMYDSAAGVTRVLVMTGIQGSAGALVFDPKITTGPLFTYSGQGTLTGIVAATKYGKAVRTALQVNAPSYAQFDSGNGPTTFGLGQNVPNPFNPVTTISFGLPEAADITLDLFNIRGQKVATVATGRYDAGNHTVVWDASSAASGIYLYRLSAGTFVQTKKMLLLK